MEEKTGAKTMVSELELAIDSLKKLNDNHKT